MSISQDDHGFEFEFCRVMQPGASPNAPADHLFSNGRLVPHDFPCSHPKTFKNLSRSVSQRSSSSGSNSGFETSSLFSNSLSRSVSERSSSFGSNSGFESLSSSGSDSCSSSQSSSSISSGRANATPERTDLVRAIRANKARKHVPRPDYGSRKWQFIAPVPVLNGNVLHRSKKNSLRKKSEVADPQKVLKSKKDGKSNGLWRRSFCF